MSVILLSAEEIYVGGEVEVHPQCIGFSTELIPCRASSTACMLVALRLQFIRDANDGSGGQGHSALGKDETLLLFLVPISYCTRREGMLLYLLW